MLSSTAREASGKKTTILLEGGCLTPEQLCGIGDRKYNIDLTKLAWQRVARGRRVTEEIVESGEVVYGINTGFGKFSDVTIEGHLISELQVNLIRSHAVGCGPPLSVRHTRMLLALRINTLSKGHSGVRSETLQQLIDALHANALSRVPCKGTVGASGDLAPLAHLALGMLGEGLMWDDEKESYEDAAAVLKKKGLKPLTLTAKEGLALINGTQMMTALGAEAVVRAKRIAQQADIVAALSLEALRGTSRAFHPFIHEVRPHPGQNKVALRLRQLLEGSDSEIRQSHRDCGAVQDSYTLRCVPQVHGIVAETIAFVEGVLTTEMNSATDNPMLFFEPSSKAGGHRELCAECELVPPNVMCLDCSDEDKLCYSCFRRLHWSRRRRDHRFDRLQSAFEGEEEEKKAGEETAAGAATADVDGDDAVSTGKRKRGSDGSSRPHKMRRTSRGFIVSGGNFHGEYPAKSLDFLAIGVHELASISERRIERLLNPSLSGLPAFLVRNGGLNSGFMMAHVTAAALVSENKGLCHPSSTDSLSTSAAKEDHVSMGGWAARKALRVVEHVETVLAIELLAAAQAIDLLRPLRTTEPLEAVHALVRSVVPSLEADRYMAPDIEAAAQLLRNGAVWDAVQPALVGSVAGM